MWCAWTGAPWIGKRPSCARWAVFCRCAWFSWALSGSRLTRPARPGTTRLPARWWCGPSEGRRWYRLEPLANGGRQQGLVAAAERDAFAVAQYQFVVAVEHG